MEKLSQRSLLGRLSIRTRLAIVVFSFVCVSVVLLAVSTFAFDVLSSVRAYVGGEGLWSKAEKDAVHSLTRYVRSHQEDDFQHYAQFVQVPLRDKAARLELQKEHSDLDAADLSFVAARNNPEDVRGMSLLFRRFSWISYLARAIELWRQADEGISELQAEGEELHQEVLSGTATPETDQAVLTRITATNTRLTALEDEFSFTLGEAARWLKRVLGLAMLLLTAGFLGLGLVISAAISRTVVDGISRLREGTEAIGRGQLGHRIEITSSDELGQLAVAFNQMTDRLVEAEEKLVQRAQQLAEANQKLVEHEQVKSQFFSNISHELRTPLSLILAPLESLLAGAFGPLPERGVDVVGTVHNNALRLLQMVQGLLDFQKLEARKMEVHREPTEVVELTRSLFADFELMMGRRGLTGRLEPLPVSTVVELDRYLYERILFNLLSNASKFTPEGGTITLRLALEADRLRVTVQDTGIGISEADQRELFQTFRQVDAASTRRFEGAGLGLALVKEFAALLGGEVTLESKPGEGSTFTVTLLAPPSTQPAAGPGNLVRTKLVEQHRALPLAAPRADAGPERVLVVEDNAELARYIADLVGQVCQVKVAGDGEEAVGVVREWRPTLILSDVMMPKKDGLTLCRELKADEATRKIPFVLLTALTYREALLKGWEAGADDYLFKPFHSTELLTRVRSLLATQRAIGALEAAQRSSDQKLHQSTVALEGREAQLAALLQAQSDLGDGVALLEARTQRVLFVNDGLCRLLGSTREELLARPFDVQLGLGGRAELLDSMRGRHFEHSLVRKDGERRALQLSLKEVEVDGAPRLVAVVRDVTDQKILQRRLHVTERLASLGMLASTVAHEINNPLSFILSNLAWASQTLAEADGHDLGQLKEAVTRAQEGARRVRNVVRDLKTFSRPDDERRGQVDVTTVVESSINMALIQVPEAPTVIREYAPVPLVEGNESRLGQVFLNLLVNAVQALSEAKGPRQITVRTGLDPQGQVLVEIRDTGVGIAPEVMGRILEPFFTTKREGVGTGLGLSISSEIITGLGGKLWVESQPGQGTSVFVRLPPAKQPAQTAQRAQPAPPAATRRASILFIDDEPLVVLAFEQILAPLHDVMGMTDPQKALELLAGGAVFDLIFCDLMMPRMSGMEFAQALSKLAPSMKSRLFFTTGGVFTPEGSEFLGQQTNPLIEKPFDEEQLKSIVGRVVLTSRPPAARS